MSESIVVSGITKAEKYESLLPQVKALVEGEQDFIANVSNIIAALKYGMEFFWVGIYLVKQNQLVLGPFQGPVACTRIALGKGVCGTAWKEQKTLIVDDVEKFPGHISCSSSSRSEIVVPCFRDIRLLPDGNTIGQGEILAVLDVDSDRLNEFDQTDRKYLEKIGIIISQISKSAE